MIHIERDEHEVLCPRCGAESQWSFVDVEKKQVEVNCPDCGQFAMSREEFDQAATDNAGFADAEGA